MSPAPEGITQVPSSRNTFPVAEPGSGTIPEVPAPVNVTSSPVLVPDKLATAPFANMAFVIAPLAIAVALPVEVTGPVRFALVVTVAALPVILIWSPVFVPDKLATAGLANIAFVITPLAMAVAFPVEVTGPVKFALVVTVVARSTVPLLLAS